MIHMYIEVTLTCTHKSHRATPSCDACLPSLIILVDTTLAFLTFKSKTEHTKDVSTVQFELRAKTSPLELGIPNTYSQPNKSLGLYYN